MCEIFVAAWFADIKSPLIHILTSRQRSVDNIADSEQAANQRYDVIAEHAGVAVASHIAVVVHVVEVVDAYVAVGAISAFEAASVAASDEKFVVEHSFDSIVYIVVAAAEHVAAVAVAGSAVEIEAEPEHFVALNIVENLHSNSAERAEDIVEDVVVADIAAVFAVGIVFAVLVEVAQPTFAVELLVVAELIEPAVLVNYVVELVEQLIVIAVVE